MTPTDAPPPPDFADLERAARRLEGAAVRTPVLESVELNRRAGRRVLLKAETLQRTGSFKFRGAYNRLAAMTPQARSRGVVAYSSGNHAQGVAAAAAAFEAPALIVMPADAPGVKIEGVRRLGGEVRLYDRWRESREALAAQLAAERGATLVPPFDDPHIIAGQGTAGLEFAQHCRSEGVTLGHLLCGASGGGLFAGLALAFARLAPEVALHVVEPEGHDDHRASLLSGRPSPTDAPGPPSLCDSLMAPQPGNLTFAINRSRIAGALAVNDAEVLNAMRFAFETLKLVVEPGGAVSLAAVLAGKAPSGSDPLGLLLTGANVDTAVFARALAF